LQAEARYNVTTECKYPLLFRASVLHSAAATGNVGLVEYALTRGQPINSVLDGVLPLHAAAAGGNESETEIPPRDRRTSGSTPLHFAAANGHTNIVHTLLLRGAHASRPDKQWNHARDACPANGWDECAEILKTWIITRIAKAKSSTRKRLHMKRSMDTALSMLKGSSEALKPPLPSASTSNLPADHINSTSVQVQSPIDPGSRRPFITADHISRASSGQPKTSLVVGGKQRRPRSAEMELAGKKLVSKYSLLNMFKKGETNASGVALERTDTQPSTSSASIPSASSSNVALPSAEASPASANLSDSPASYMRRASNMSPSPQSSQLPGCTNRPSTNALAQHQHRDPFRIWRKRTIRPGCLQGQRVPGSSAGNRSGSVFDDDFVVTGDTVGRSARPGPGILRVHNRSISNGPAPPAAVRALRFDSHPGAEYVGYGTAREHYAGKDFPAARSLADLLVPIVLRAFGDSINPQMSASGTTSGSGSVTVLAVSPQGSPLPLQVHNTPPTMISSRLNEHINLSLISSHAQASALVQKELQDILEMPTTNFSLQLERRFRSDGTSPISPGGASSGSNLGPQSRPRHNGVDRQNSMDIKPTRRRVKEPKRPHTSSGTDSPSTESIPTHHSSRSTSAVSSQADLRADRTVPIVAQTAATAAEVARANNRVRRARTPDPVIGLSRVSSLDGIESIDVELGPTLTRVSTAPMAPGSRDKSRDFAKQMASANKLTRMGFSPAPAKPDPAQSKRFGGLRSLVNTLKGKP
ncbi:hypothetical protein B0H14DRAFT_3029798, partial [Mycena olivaceomarginata]